MDKINKSAFNKPELLNQIIDFYHATFLKEKRGIKYLVDKGIKSIKGDESALFVTVAGNRMTPGTLMYTVWKYSYKMQKSITCHSFRHSCATHLLRGGADMRVIQAILGHNSQDTTQIYTRVVPVDLKDMLKKCHPRERQKKEKAGEVKDSMIY